MGERRPSIDYGVEITKRTPRRGRLGRGAGYVLCFCLGMGATAAVLLYLTSVQEARSSAAVAAERRALEMALAEREREIKALDEEMVARGSQLVQLGELVKGLHERVDKRAQRAQGAIQRRERKTDGGRERRKC